MSQTLSLPVTGAGRQQHDLYDLPLSTTPSAAEQFRDAQARLLRVQTGVTAPLQRAVALDPEFALGHAVLAMVGHDLDLSIDTVAHLRAALHLGGPGQRPRAQLRRRRVGPAPGRSRAPGPVAAAPGRAPARRARAEHGRPDHRLLRRGRGARAGLGAGRVRASGVRLGLVVRRPAGLRPAGAGPLRRGRRPGPRGVGSRAHGRARRPRAGPRLLRDRAGTATGCAGSTTGSATTGPPRSSPRTTRGTRLCTSSRSATRPRYVGATSASSRRRASRASGP